MSGRAAAELPYYPLTASPFVFTASPLVFTASLPKQKLSRAKSRQLRRLYFVITRDLGYQSQEFLVKPH